MTNISNIKFTIAFNDPELDAEEQEEQAQKLFNQMRKLDEVETVSRVEDPNPPKGNKSIGAILVGVLTAEVNAANIKAMFGFLSDRLGGKPIEMEVEANGKKLKVKASSQQELMAAIQAAQEFIAV